MSPRCCARGARKNERNYGEAKKMGQNREHEMHTLSKNGAPDTYYRTMCVRRRAPQQHRFYASLGTNPRALGCTAQRLGRQSEGEMNSEPVSARARGVAEKKMVAERACTPIAV